VGGGREEGGGGTFTDAVISDEEVIETDESFVTATKVDVSAETRIDYITHQSGGIVGELSERICHEMKRGTI